MPQCEVADANCTAANEWGGDPEVMRKCYACGLPCCIDCSIIVPYRRKGPPNRVCFNCVQDWDRAYGEEIIEQFFRFVDEKKPNELQMRRWRAKLRDFPNNSYRLDHRNEEDRITPRAA